MIRAALSAEEYRVVHRMNADEAEPLLVHGIVSACILDIDLMGVQGVWAIEGIRRRDAKCPIIAYTADTASNWEEEAFLQGVTHILTTRSGRDCLLHCWNVYGHRRNIARRRRRRCLIRNRRHNFPARWNRTRAVL